MLQGMLVKKIIDIIMKQLLKQFKLDKIQKYVEEPNELDKQVKAMKKDLNKYGKYIEEAENKLEKSNKQKMMNEAYQEACEMV